MTVVCPECASVQPESAVVCSRCGARLRPAARAPFRLRLADYLSYSGVTIVIILVALSVPCLVGLLCFYLSR